MDSVYIDMKGEHWTDCLVAQGVPEFDVMFLYAVLLTVDQILDLGYLDAC